VITRRRGCLARQLEPARPTRASVQLPNWDDVGEGVGSESEEAGMTYEDLSFSERNRYISIVETLPPNYLDGNAAPLLRAVEELRKSLTQEIIVIQQVKRVDPEDLSAVGKLALTYEDYQESRDPSHDRSHCANIGRAMDTLRPPDVPLNKVDKQKVDNLKGSMSLLRSADTDFLDKSTELVDNAVEVLKSMRLALEKGDVASSKRLHEEFLITVKDRISKLKQLLARMTEVSGDLIDRLA
jgi:hypothetical protein